MTHTDTATLLRTIAGGKPDEGNIRSIVSGLERYGAGAGLDRRARFAHYAPQLAHESGRFQYDREVWGPTPAQLRYEDRKVLGHSAAVPGEAFKFRGRTAMQITGRYNTRRFRDWCRVHVDPAAPDFEAEPGLMNTDPWEGLGPIWYWDAGNPTGESLNIYADDNNAEAVTRWINGGLNGFEDRLALYTRSALVLLGYELVEGVVRRFQADVGFAGRDLDDIPGAKTRSAMHQRLLAAPRLAFGSAAASPAPAAVDLREELAGVRRLLSEADRRLASLEGSA